MENKHKMPTKAQVLSAHSINSNTRLRDKTETLSYIFFRSRFFPPL